MMDMVLEGKKQDNFRREKEKGGGTFLISYAGNILGKKVFMLYNKWDILHHLVQLFWCLANFIVNFFP